MKKLLVIAIVLAPAAAFAQGIAGTPHDLSDTNATYTSTTNQICVYCHTPHNANSTLALWNRTIPSYQLDWTDTGTTSDGTPLGGVTGGQPTQRCLSCHDGVTAMSAVTRPPQSGAITVTGGNLDGAGVLDGGTSLAIFDNTAMDGMHPVSIPYAGEIYLGVTSAATITAVGGGGYADGSSGTVATMPLYQGTTGGDSYGIECGSCHEPHIYGANTDLQFYFCVIMSGL